MNMATSSELAARAGLEVIGQQGTAEDARSVWKAIISGAAVPIDRIPETDDYDHDAALLEAAWDQIALEHGLVSHSGEFLLSVEGDGDALGAWTRVCRRRAIAIRELGQNPGIVEFVASDLARTVSVGVTTEEDDYQIFVAYTDPATGETPVPIAQRRV
jgi:hypothetical protein